MTWAEYVGWLVEEHGSLAAVAQQAAGSERDAASVERALRRLRAKKNGDGGDWGRRLLRTFGLPPQTADRVKWLGVYHSRFTDLPVDLCLDQLRAWNKPPLSASPHRIWLALGFASCALRQGDLTVAERHLRDARAVASAPADARLELGLLTAFIATKRDLEPDLLSLGPLVDEAKDPCLTARWLDQGAYGRTLPEARALYEQISDEHPFTSAKRHAGLAYVAWQEGRIDVAREHADIAIASAGDGGYTRLRLTYLGLLAHIAGGEEGELLRERAVKAAEQLGDVELAARLRRTAESDEAESTRLHEAARRRSAAPAPRSRRARS